MENQMEEMLTRLKLTAIRDRLDNLLDEAGRRDMTHREALHYFCQEEILSKDHQRVRMGMKIAKFPYERTLDQFEFDAQPALDPKQMRELALGRWVANGDAVLLLGPRAWVRRI